MVGGADNGSFDSPMSRPFVCLAAEKGRGQEGARPEPSSDPVRDMREPFPSDGIRVEQVELARRLTTERRGREPDQAHALRESFSREQGRHATVELETILGRIAGLAPRDGPKIGEPELQGHAAGGHALLAKLAADALGLSAKGGLQPAPVVDVAAERGFGTHGLRRSPRADGPVVMAEGKLAQRAGVTPETIDQNPPGHRLE